MSYHLKKQIIIRTSFKGTHNWPEASQFAGKEVGFLEDVHRHTFHLQVELEVSGSDREVEFFVFQGQVDKVIQELYPKEGLVRVLGRRSCETMAEEIIERLRNQYGYLHSTITVEAWEDNEVGGRVKSLFTIPENKTD